MILKNEIDLKGGHLSYYDFNIDSNVPLELQIYDIKEDLIQIVYGDHYLLDVGWYPEFNVKGSFVIRIIKDCDWQIPVIEKSANLSELKQVLQECIDMAVDLTSKSRT